MLLTRAIEAEVAEWIEQHRHLTEEGGRRQVVRNGFLPQRRLVTGLGDVYLKGISTGDFQEALAAILGPDCPGLSATTVTRLKTVWEQEYQEWSSRSFEGRDYVYVWGLRLG